MPCLVLRTPKRFHSPAALKGAEELLALVRQIEYIDEPNPGDYRHVKEVRNTEWPCRVSPKPSTHGDDNFSFPFAKWTRHQAGYSSGSSKTG